MLSIFGLGYFSLFLASFLAATILPFSSEVIFSLMLFGGLDAWLCVLVATMGNWLGGMTCYYLGLLGRIEWLEKYFKIKKENIEKYTTKINQYGSWFAFFSFLPIIGDVIAVASGFFRCKLWVVALAMLIGKFTRYVIWMYLNGIFI